MQVSGSNLVTEQLSQLRALLAALRTNPFYARKLRGTGLLEGVASLAEFNVRCPFTTKAELVTDQQAQPPYGTNLTFPLDRYTRCHQQRQHGQPAPLARHAGELDVDAG